jgi:hypothetical protein
VLPDSGFVELDDTIIPRARPLNGAGDSVAGTVYWAALDTAVATVLDSETGATLGKAAGIARIQARTGTLRSNPVTLVVQPPLDSIRPAGDLRDTVVTSSTPPDTLSDSLLVRVFAPMPPSATHLRRRITYELAVFPSAGSAITLVPNDTVFTNTGGTAAVQVRLDAGPLPDSVVVTARAARHDGTPIDSSLTFVVEFRP